MLDDNDGAAVVTDADQVRQMNCDWMGRWEGEGTVAIRPSTTEQVSAVLEHCNRRRIAVVPQGGNTGLVGGSIPVHDELVLAMGRMSKVISFDSTTGILVCEAGCVLEDLDHYLEQHGFMMPLDLGAKGTCQIGGNASTNAGGLRYIRYGSLHGSILGMEAVLADGTVLDCLNTMRKDNTGYDLKQLFIGAEGTLGIVTKLAILTPRRSSSKNVLFLGLKDYPSVRETFVQASNSLGEILSAVEFVDQKAVETVLDQTPGTRYPLGEPFPFHVLIETSGSNSEHDSDKLNLFLDEVMTGGLVQDGVLAQDEAQAHALWTLREGVGPACSSLGLVYKYDISIPIDQMYDIVEETRKRLSGHKDVLVVGYGHLGDSNLHLNVAVPAHNPAVLELLEPYVFEWTTAVGGSISAEHGVGQCKNKFLAQTKPPAVLSLMRQVKNVFDPQGILNPYKVLM